MCAATLSILAIAASSATSALTPRLAICALSGLQSLCGILIHHFSI
jgi:hypothetical protein